MPTALHRKQEKRTSLNIRIKPDKRRLIDRAARMKGKNRTDFILEASCQAAEETLLDQTIFMVSPKVYAEFFTRLDANPEPNKRLHKTMHAKDPWE